MDSINSYLSKKFNQFPSYPLTERDERIIKGAGLQEYFYRRIASRKYRSSSIPKEIEKIIRDNISAKFSAQKPIVFAIPIGGYKKRQWDSSPYIDWAEVFNVWLLAEYASQITAAYKPGVEVEYVSNEIDMELLGNYSRQELRAYSESFQEILEFLNKVFPANFKVVFREMRDQFKPGEYDRCLEKARPDLNRLYKEFDALPKEEREKRIQKAARNYKFSSKEESLSENEKYEILKRTLLLHDMYVNPIWLSFLSKKNYIRNENKIPISFYHSNWGIHLKSSPASTAQFWAGKGLLIEKGNTFLPAIFTSSQYEKVKDKILVKKVDLFPNSLKNLKSIPIFQA